jgi:predicted choloylglycine hydrolase
VTACGPAGWHDRRRTGGISGAYGGRRDRGSGFGIPLVVRYLLEVAERVAEATSVVARVPVNMAYNLTLLDAHVEAATAFVAPGVAPELSALDAATNHGGEVPDCPEHAAIFRSVQRQRVLLDLTSVDRCGTQLTRRQFADNSSPGLSPTRWSRRSADHRYTRRRNTPTSRIRSDRVRPLQKAWASSFVVRRRGHEPQTAST